MNTKLKQYYNNYKELNKQEDTGNALEFLMIVVILVVIFFK